MKKFLNGIGKMIFQEENPEFHFDDKEFKGMSLSEAMMDSWVCLHDNRVGAGVVRTIFGENWKIIPISAVHEILNLKFGDQFQDKSKAFNYDTWSVLWHFERNLSPDQKEFLEKHKFLPHKYNSAREAVDNIKKQKNKLQISIEEHINFNQEDLAEKLRNELRALEEKERELIDYIKQWEQNHPYGGNPADAAEYYQDKIELRSWLEENEELARIKTQGIEIIIQQMHRASYQSSYQKKPGVSYTQSGFYDFGQSEERAKRIKKHKEEFILEQQRKQAAKKQQEGSGPEKAKKSRSKGSVMATVEVPQMNWKPVITQAFSIKNLNFMFPEFAKEHSELNKDTQNKSSSGPKVVNVDKPVQQHNAEPTADVHEEKPKEESFEDILKEAKRREQGKISNDINDQAEEQSFDALEYHKQKVMKKINQNKEKQAKSSSSNNWPKKITIGVVSAVIMGTILYLIFA